MGDHKWSPWSTSFKWFNFLQHQTTQDMLQNWATAQSTDNSYQIKTFYQVTENFTSARIYLLAGLSFSYFKLSKTALNVTSLAGIMKYSKYCMTINLIRDDNNWKVFLWHEFSIAKVCTEMDYKQHCVWRLIYHLWSFRFCPLTPGIQYFLKQRINFPKHRICELLLQLLTVLQNSFHCRL